jgi:hypothetical protein
MKFNVAWNRPRLILILLCSLMFGYSSGCKTSEALVQQSGSFGVDAADGTFDYTHLTPILVNLNLLAMPVSPDLSATRTRNGLFTIFISGLGSQTQVFHGAFDESFGSVCLTKAVVAEDGSAASVHEVGCVPEGAHGVIDSSLYLILDYPDPAFVRSNLNGRESLVHQARYEFFDLDPAHFNLLVLSPENTAAAVRACRDHLDYIRCLDRPDVSIRRSQHVRR